MNINETFRDWVQSKQGEFDSIANLDIITMGETDDREPPFLGIMEGGSAVHESSGVIMRGVSEFEIVCELHTVPAAEDQEGTAPETEREMRRDLYDILGDEAAIPWMDGRNDWLVFDIRLASPITEASEGRRISRWSMLVIACPL